MSTNPASQSTTGNFPFKRPFYAAIDMKTCGSHEKFNFICEHTKVQYLHHVLCRKRFIILHCWNNKQQCEIVP